MEDILLIEREIISMNADDYIDKLERQAGYEQQKNMLLQQENQQLKSQLEQSKSETKQRDDAIDEAIERTSKIKNLGFDKIAKKEILSILNKRGGTDE